MSSRLLLESVLNTVGQMTKERNQKLIAEVRVEMFSYQKTEIVHILR